MINTTLSIGTNKIAATIIDIIGEETTKVYSKSVFNEEKVIASEVEETIKALEADLDNGNNKEVK
jgi:predicted NBD/HSP70 family sugar kinase